jgi:hypothetical protein
LDPTSAVHHTNTFVTFDTLQQAAFQPGQELLAALYQADIDYGFFDFNQNSINPPLLFYGGGARLSAESQARLRQYILEGGHLVCLGSYPRLDDYSRPLNLLEIPDPEGIIGDVPEDLKIEISYGKTQAIGKTSWLAYYTDTLEHPISATRLQSEKLTAEELILILSLVQGDEYTVGFTREWGQGKLTVVNVASSVEMVRALHQMAGVNIPVTSETPGIHTSLYSRENYRYVIVTNNSAEDKSALIKIDPEMLESHDYRVSDLVSDEEWVIQPQNIPSLTVKLPRKDATMLKLSPQ